MGTYPTNKKKHQNNIDDLSQFLSKNYKENYMIFNFSYRIVLSNSPLRTEKYENLSFMNQTVNFDLENYSLDMIFRILYCIDYWNHNPKHCGIFNRMVTIHSCVTDDAFLSSLNSS